MELEIKDNCIICSKQFDWNEPIVGKIPENVWFCLDCSERFPDDTEYSGIDCWMALENKDY